MARESAGDDPVQRLRELGTEVARIAQALGALGPGAGVADRRPRYRGEAADGDPLSAPVIRQMIRARGRVTSISPPNCSPIRHGISCSI